jgi:hypothetical protein
MEPLSVGIEVIRIAGVLGPLLVMLLGLCCSYSG